MLLPPVNKVWGKVIFSRVFFLFTGGKKGAALYDVTSCLAAWSHVPSTGVSVPGSMFCPQGSLTGGGLCRGGGHCRECPPPSESGKWGVHSLLECFLVFNFLLSENAHTFDH